MQLSTTIYTHQLIFPDGEGRKDMPITENRAKAMLAFLSDPNKQSHFHLVGEGGGIKEAIPRSILSRSKIKEIERSKDLVGKRWVCDYGVRHFLHESVCSCYALYFCKELGVRAPFMFREWARKRFSPKKFPYADDLTDLIRETFLQDKNLLLNSK